MKTALFDFHLPPERIAAEPLSPRDASRMLVVRSDGLTDDKVRNLTDYLRPGDVMVFNDTKVIPARLMGKRGEATIEIMLLKCIDGNCWSAFARPAKKLRLGDNVIFADGFLAAVNAKCEDGTVEIIFNSNELFDDLYKYGKMPLPPYIKRSAEEADNTNYQTVYAQNEGAIAAPTAGLHFTEELLKNIDKAGIKRVNVTLHVGAGTFQPVKSDDTDSHVMHSEYAELTESNAELLMQYRKNGGRIIAVGTTSLRVLESATDVEGNINAYKGETDIFITPGYKFRAVDILMTNFHLPKSTLFMLVSAFMGLDEMKAAYAHAIAEGYRLYSYGDAGLLIR
jgi:S-adenosylmethionine:tRNA ribosyltransferase-isomerase